ncbi:hypothetical protein [Cellulomonas xiejunii]|uniref:Lipoprotein n=1 Tax=Cellulomonas xiejunii TaxID=2968083 RepID=A0ABY5KL67_9CELL|nr:hypothetical protein [Cellulomonas xiejunii]MCC2312734.1 hypothetical protein [Cellulomonas xiejunii]MCC2320396.1 hypothetical protein [Cellulomonas xiejunii]UUI70693.1 hypothetical protein NP048_12925 [Cellulomonas xiejunii]
MSRVRALPVALVVLALVGCTSTSAPDPTGTGTVSPSAGTDELTIEEFAESVLVGQAGADEGSPLVTLQGSLEEDPGVPLSVDVLTLDTTATGTDMTFTVATGDGSTTGWGPTRSWTTPGESAFSDVRGITLTVETTATSLRPYTVMTHVADGLDMLCACSDFPLSLDGDRRVLTALFPPLPAGVETATLGLPGFEPVEVPVTRS